MAAMDAIRLQVSTMLRKNLELMDKNDLVAHGRRIDDIMDHITVMQGRGGDERVQLVNQLLSNQEEARRRAQMVAVDDAVPVAEGRPRRSVRPQDIRSYDGTPRDWRRYKAEVNCYIVHTDMTPAQKLVELKKTIGEERVGLLAQYEENGSVTAAMEELEKMFGSVSGLVDELKSRVEALPLLKRTSPVEDWQRVLTAAHEIATIEGERLMVEQLTTILLDKLPGVMAFNLRGIENISIQNVIETM